MGSLKLKKIHLVKKLPWLVMLYILIIGGGVSK